MARQRGKEDPTGSGGDADPSGAAKEASEASSGGVPDLMRRALSMGFSGFFTTEEAVRKALGDTVPKDWIDFAVDQSGRAREDFLERISVEIGRSFAEVDLAEVLAKLFEGRTVEVTARIKLAPSDEGEKSGINLRVEGEKSR